MRATRPAHLIRLHPLKPKLVYILFKNPVRTSKRTPYFTITKINQLVNVV
jgi:hypothetical protein